MSAVLSLPRIAAECYLYSLWNAASYLSFRFFSWPDSLMTCAKVSGKPLTMPKATKRFILMAAFAALAFVTCSASGFAADAQRGKQFAGRVCAICHVVFDGQSPGDPNAPSFRAIAKSRQFREKGVELLWENHPKMPNLALTQKQSDDVAAYIKSLSK